MRLDVEEPRPATLEQTRGVDDPTRLPNAGSGEDVVATALGAADQLGDAMAVRRVVPVDEPDRPVAVAGLHLWPRVARAVLVDRDPVAAHVDVVRAHRPVLCRREEVGVEHRRQSIRQGRGSEPQVVEPAELVDRRAVARRDEVEVAS
jgi:hypothetical protein